LRSACRDREGISLDQEWRAAGQRRLAWTFNMDGIRIFFAQVRIQHRVKTKFSDNQIHRRYVKRNLSVLNLVFSIYFPLEDKGKI